MFRFEVPSLRTIKDIQDSEKVTAAMAAEHTAAVAATNGQHTEPYKDPDTEANP